jgi:hypothetical protein
VLDHDPSNSEFGLRLKDFGWNPSFLVELSCDSIPDDLVRLRAQVLGYSISYGRFMSPPNLSSRAQVVCEILVDSESARGLVFVQFVTYSCAFMVRSVGEVDFGCTVFADSPPARRGQSTRYEFPSDGPRVAHGWSVFQGVVLVGPVAFSDCPPRVCG